MIKFIIDLIVDLFDIWWFVMFFTFFVGIILILIFL